MKNNKIIRFILKHLISITACVLLLAFSVGYYWVSSQTTIGDDISVASDLTVNGTIASSGSDGVFTTPSYNTTGWKSVTVTFPIAFSTVPTVVVTRENLANADFVVKYIRVQNITTTSFNVVFYIEIVGSVGTTKVHWIAIQ